MDVSAAYRGAVSAHLKEAVIAFDHVHVIELFDDALSDLRRTPCHLAEADQQKVPKGGRWLLPKNPENLDTDEDETARLEEAPALNTPLAAAYDLKDDLRQSWEQLGKRFAPAFLDDWLRRAEASGVRGVAQQMARTLATRRSGLRADDDARITGGPREGTNDKSMTRKRIAYGFRDRESSKLKILATHETRHALVGQPPGYDYALTCAGACLGRMNQKNGVSRPDGRRCQARRHRSPRPSVRCRSGSPAPPQASIHRRPRLSGRSASLPAPPRPAPPRGRNRKMSILSLT